MNFINVALVLFALLLLGCSSTSPEQVARQNALSHLEKDWKLLSIDGDTVNPNINSTLHLDIKRKATGSLGCNLFWANAELKDNKFIIKRIASTRKMCNKKANNVEKKVINVFTSGSQLQVSQTTLILTGKTHTLKYRYKIN